MNTEALTLIEELKTTASHPAASVKKAMAETGKKAVGCFPIYAPEELVYAAGALPVGMWGGPQAGSAGRLLHALCRYSDHLLRYAQMRNGKLENRSAGSESHSHGIPAEP